MRNQLVYDLPTRLFHWLFSGLFIAAFLITKVADNESPVFSYHMLFGLTLSFVVILRIVWGITGSQYARFSSFSLNPNDLKEYFINIFSRKSIRSLGHNPASSWAAITMMLLALGLGITGYLMATGNKETFEDIHEIFANTFVVIVVFHVVGIILHTLKHKDNIGFSMVDGKKAAVVNEVAISSSYPIVASIFVLLVTVFAFNLYKNYDSQNRSLNLFGTTLQLGENENSEPSNNKTEDEDHDND